MPSKLICVAVLSAALAGCKEKAADPPKKIEPVAQPSPDPAPAMRKPTPDPTTGSGSGSAGSNAADVSRPDGKLDRAKPGSEPTVYEPSSALERLKKRNAAKSGSGSAAEPKKP